MKKKDGVSSEQIRNIRYGLIYIEAHNYYDIYKKAFNEILGDDDNLKKIFYKALKKYIKDSVGVEIIDEN